MTNIICLLYVGWVTNYIANIYIKVPMPLPETKLEGDKRGDTLRIMERLDRLENVVNQHIQGKAACSYSLITLQNLLSTTGKFDFIINIQLKLNIAYLQHAVLYRAAAAFLVLFIWAFMQ